MITKAIQAALESPCTRRQLKAAINEFLDMDPVDAMHDANHLAALFQARADALLGGPAPRHPCQYFGDEHSIGISRASGLPICAMCSLDNADAEPNATRAELDEAEPPAPYRTPRPI